MSSNRLLCLAMAVGLGGLVASPAPAEEGCADQPFAAPLLVRDYTFPSFLVLGMPPLPAHSLCPGAWALHVGYSRVNDFQASPEVESYLDKTRAAGERRALDTDDIAAVLALPAGRSYFIDGEFEFVEVSALWGLTEGVDLGFAVSYVGFTDGALDGTIFDFHDTFGYGQQGRQFIADNGFQVVLGLDDGFVVDGRPNAGGLSDPALYLRWTTAAGNRWSTALTVGAKAPLADEREFLSTGSWDYGAQVAIERRGRRDLLLLNLGLVVPGDYVVADFDPPTLPSVNLSWLHGFGASQRVHTTVQLLAAEHPFRDIVDSGISELEFQATLGARWTTSAGTLGIGLTENLLSFDNTPDIGLHASWSVVFD